MSDDLNLLGGTSHAREGNRLDEGFPLRHDLSAVGGVQSEGTERL